MIKKTIHEPLVTSSAFENNFSKKSFKYERNSNEVMSMKAFFK